MTIDTLRSKSHWLFDMDGTLTHAIHDFDAIRDELGLPAGKPILESIARLPDNEAVEINEKLDSMEYRIAEQATAHPGSEALLQTLADNGHQVAILTRNGHGIAMATLKACNLDRFFTEQSIISRDCCAPKPDPAGVHLMIKRWNTSPENTVMVGDYLFDLEAGKRAGTTTVHLDTSAQYPWPEYTDFGVSSLEDVAALWQPHA